MVETNLYAMCNNKDLFESLSFWFRSLTKKQTYDILVAYKIMHLDALPADPPEERTPKHLFLLLCYRFPRFDIDNPNQPTMGAFINANLPVLDDYLDRGDAYLLGVYNESFSFLEQIGLEEHGPHHF